MPSVKCPIADCEYSTEDIADASVVAALLNLHANSHQLTASTPPITVKAEKLKRPTVMAAGSSEEWSYFKTRWTEYKNGSKLCGTDIVIQLLECCDEGLRRDLTRMAGGSLVNKSEQEVLNAIEALAVRRENSMVARATLHDMRQDRDEPIRAFGARIRGQANVCKYLIKCPSCSTDVNYTDAILRDVLTRGIADHEIQLSVLGDRNQNMTFEEVLSVVEAKELGRLSASRLIESHGAEAASSTYRQHKRREAHTKPAHPCNYCGRKGHGKSAPIHIRKTECPAYNQKCRQCGRDHHFAEVCRSQGIDRPKMKTTVGAQDTSECEGAVFESLCGVNDVSPSGRLTALDHHRYDETSGKWQKRASKPQPIVTLTANILAEDYEEFGFRLWATTKPVTVHAMADTGCQSCLVGINVINRMGLKRKHLIPSSMRMHAANNNDIRILGAAILRFTGSGEIHLETRQMVYVTDNSDQLYLSREACIELGLISKSFPKLGETFGLGSYAATEDQQISSSIICNCPKRDPPPPLPTDLPFPPDEGNRQNLHSYLLNHYRSSTFNTCEHQPLPMMRVPPMRLMVDSSAEPFACHTPIPVPLHWQEEVKAGLDQDVRLGVIEEVPIGTPVTWCHRMVVCAKKSGKPRRTVDFQRLNAHATRETHHTQSPFHQARSIPPNKLKTVF